MCLLLLLGSPMRQPLPEQSGLVHVEILMRKISTLPDLFLLDDVENPSQPLHRLRTPGL